MTIKDERAMFVRSLVNRKAAAEIQPAPPAPQADTRPAPSAKQVGVSQQSIFAAIATLLDDERALTDKDLAALAKRLDQVDSTAILQSAAVAVMQANLSSVREYANTITHKRAKLVRGKAPSIAEGLL